MKIELLYPEVAHLFGELGDIDFLIKSYPEAEIIRTRRYEKPRFLDEQVDLVFFGPMTESAQTIAIAGLMPYREAVREKIEGGQAMLSISNAVEIFGQFIETDDNEKTEALGIFPFFTRQRLLNRQSGIFIGKKGDLELIGLKAQFTELFKTGEIPSLCEVKRGFGLNRQSKEEGIVWKNFLGTHILGPFLVANPIFAKAWLSEQFPGETFAFPFYELAVSAYRKHREDLETMRPARF